MKPRQIVDRFTNSSVHPYQQQQQHQASLTMPPPPPSLSDLDLAKLGLSREDLVSLNHHHQQQQTLPSSQPQSLPPTLPAINPNFSNSQEELFKCIQALYGKNSAEILQKLPPSNSDWPLPSLSPNEFQRMVGASGGGGGIHSGNSSNSSGRNSGNVVGSGTGTNFGNNNTSTGLQKHDTHFVNSNSHSHQAPANVNQFRVSQQQQISQQKSVLSLHQHHQRNDLSNRRLNRHHMSATSASFANLTTASAATSSSSSSNTDTNNLTALGGNNNVNSRNSISTGVVAHGGSIMDTFNSMDNLLYDGNLQATSKDTSSTNPQQLIRHLLKATGGGPLNSSPNPPSQGITSRSEPQSIRNISSNNMPLGQLQQTTSCAPKTISPPQSSSYSSVPKSLLNLAACSSSSPSSTSATLPSASKIGSITNLSLLSNRNQNNSAVSRNINNQSNNISGGINSSKYAKTTITNNNHVGSGGETSLLKPGPSAVSNSTCWSNNSKQLHMSLLSDSKNSSQNQRSTPAASNANKEIFLANLQERAARAGFSIGEMSKSSQPPAPTNYVQMSANSVNNAGIVGSQTPQLVHSPNTNQLREDSLDRREIESAISRVEARNDLSLLYPPMLLASNSQKQINALSAGLQGEESEFFTKEVRRIVLEECNIIYECKECNNLFRSLANLVKHKRTYCTERASNQNDATSKEQPAFNISRLNADSQQASISSDKSSGVTFRSLRDKKEPQAPQPQPETLRAKLQSLNSNNQSTSGPSGKQTSLSRLLQTQPKNRLTTNKDSPSLMDALKMTPDTASVYSLTDVNEKLVQNSSLAKTLLSEKVKSGANIAQSLIELTKAESIQQPVVIKRANPKKNLEDCINKVKQSVTDIRNLNFRPTATSEHEIGLQPTASKAINSSPYDSDDASDMLTIDLDQPRTDTLTPARRGRRRVSTAASSTTSSTGSTSKLNTSSALLKALTRPVDINKGKTYESNLVEEEKLKLGEISVEQHDITETDTKLGSVDPKGETTNELQDAPSPLFSSYCCDICDISDFKDLPSLMSHTVETHTKETIVFPCIFCSFSFIALENVCRHIIDIHSKPKSQIQSLSKVVLSRSYMSSDFATCGDYPSAIEQPRTKDDDPVEDLVVEVCESNHDNDFKEGAKNPIATDEDVIDVEDAGPSEDNNSVKINESNNVRASQGKNIRADDVGADVDEDDDDGDDMSEDNQGAEDLFEDEENLEGDPTESLNGEATQYESKPQENFSKEDAFFIPPEKEQNPDSSSTFSSESGSTSSPPGTTSCGSSRPSSLRSPNSSSCSSRSESPHEEGGDTCNDAEDILLDKRTTSHVWDADSVSGDANRPTTSRARKRSRTSSPSKDYQKPSKIVREEPRQDASLSSESDADSGGGDNNELEKTPHHSEASAHSADRRISPSSRSTSETNPPATSSSSGLMKLKITLKTRPDEKKSKVYEIV